jgi:opacity protein-like surface antigen
MKKLCLLLGVIVALFMVTPVSAQHSIGFCGGLNLAKLSFDPDLEGVDKSFRTAFGAGGVLDLRLAENVALHLEPMYLQKGVKLEGGGEEAKVKLAYIEVPVLFKIALGTSTTRPYLMAGPAIGFLLSSKLTNGGEEDLKDQTEDIDFGLNFGAGLSFPAGTNTIFVEGRYALGLTDIAKEGTGEEDEKVKTNGIQIMAGVTFPLGGSQ